MKIAQLSKDGEDFYPVIGSEGLANVIPVTKGGTGQTTVASARNALGLGNTSGALPVANGGTGCTSVAEKYVLAQAVGVTGQYNEESYYPMTITVPDGYGLLCVGPLVTSGFVGAGYIIGFNDDNIFLKTGTFDIHVWMSKGGYGAIKSDCVCVKL